MNLIEYGCNLVEHLPLVEFAYNNSYNNSYNFSISMASFKAFYGRRCRSSIIWFKHGEADMFDPNLVYQAMKKVKVIRDRLNVSQSCQKSYADLTRRDLEFEVGDKVFLRVSPMN